MKTLASTLFLVSLAVALSAASAEASWSKRGWYLKRPGANCVLRKVVTTGIDGRVIIRKVRVCR